MTFPINSKIFGRNFWIFMTPSLRVSFLVHFWQNTKKIKPLQKVPGKHKKYVEPYDTKPYKVIGDIT
jgi:hypothetical protein